MIEGDIRDAAALDTVFSAHRFDAVMHFAALAQVLLPEAERTEIDYVPEKKIGHFGFTLIGAFRICFVWTPEGPAAVEITDYH